MLIPGCCSARKIKKKKTKNKNTFAKSPNMLVIPGLTCVRNQAHLHIGSKYAGILTGAAFSLFTGNALNMNWPQTDWKSFKKQVEQTFCQKINKHFVLFLRLVFYVILFYFAAFLAKTKNCSKKLKLMRFVVVLCSSQS